MQMLLLDVSHHDQVNFFGVLLFCSDVWKRWTLFSLSLYASCCCCCNCLQLSVWSTGAFRIERMWQGVMWAWDVMRSCLWGWILLALCQKDEGCTLRADWCCCCWQDAGSFSSLSCLLPVVSRWCVFIPLPSLYIPVTTGFDRNERRLLCSASSCNLLMLKMRLCSLLWVGVFEWVSVWGRWILLAVKKRDAPLYYYSCLMCTTDVRNP